MNIVFSTTRQWNPGDEFILMGCINLLKQKMGDFNPIIYNRNPQTRRARKYDIIKAIDKAVGKDFVEKFLDNSVKERPPMDYADMVVFAGSPEWRGRRMVKLYSSILEFNLPTLFLGLGTSGNFTFTAENFTEEELKVFRKAQLITTRDTDTQAGLEPLKTYHLPCPALLSSQSERLVKKVKRIGLMYGTDSAVSSNNVSSKTYQYMMTVYNKLLRDYGEEYEIEFVSHYIDELSPFRKDFTDQPIRYSYDSKDYLDIYNRYDFVIGYRVHGIGISASMGIPGIMLAHDKRAATVRGFLADIVEIGTPYDEMKRVIDESISHVEHKSHSLIDHKKVTHNRYLELLNSHLHIG